jgi:autotransporter-associated beta strand protein
MRHKGKLVLAGSMVGLAIPVKSMGGTPIVAYNFGPTATGFTYAATTVATGVTASGIDSTNDFGDADTFTQDDGQASAYYANDPGGGVNILSVESSQSSTDDNFWIETIVTANAGYVIDPTSFELYGGAGGSSVVRSAYIYDSADDALTSNITPNPSGAPTGTNTMANPLQASGTFTAVRSTSSNMNEIQANFTSSADVNLTSFIVRVYFDTQGNVSKNIDLGYLELDGSVVAQPVTLTWNNTGGTGNGTTWDTSNQNWNNDTGPATYSDGDNVTFNDTNNNNYAVTLNTTVNPGSIIVNNSSGNYTISGTGTIAGSGSLTKTGTSSLILSTSNTYTGGTFVNGGTLVVGANGALPSGQALSIGASGTVQLATNTGGETLSSLSITSGGVLDITNNHVILSYTTDPNTTILGYLSTGSNGGAWNGPGIISSTAASNSSYGVGYADGADGIDTSLTSGEIEVAYVQYGDITLSGLVNANDFHILTTNFGHVVTGGWEDGDFTYTGTVNANDFHLLTGNFGKTESGEDLSMPASDWAAIDAFAAANGLSVSSVPEPATASLTAVMCAALLARRRRSARS